MIEVISWKPLTIKQRRIEGYIATGRQKHGEEPQPCPRGPLPKGATRVDRMRHKATDQDRPGDLFEAQDDRRTSLRTDLQFSLNDGDNVTCTFVNQLPGQINARAFSDVNRDGQRQAGEPRLHGWSMQVYSSPAILVASGVTGTNGTVPFPNLQPNVYTACGCRPGQTLPVLFGNTR